MADADHLEKMGRELQCPICWSLLNCPVSLGCNHFFCNLCISNSMKLRSNCPVCEVPFRRREIRPAPHMENLIGIFRSMEAAAGLNIFTTQTAPSFQNSDAGKCDNENKQSELPNTVEQGAKKEKKSVPRAEARESKQVNIGGDPQVLAVPIFPSKKRVHVTPYAASETPLQPKRLRKLRDPADELEPAIDLNADAHDIDLNVEAVDIGKSDAPNEALGAKGYSNPVLSPFFWLRDDEDFEATGHTTSQRSYGSDLPEPITPSFSDIKDLDDDSLSKKSPTIKSPKKQNFDSEMFEWTQRECSPELFSTPTKKVSNKGFTAILEDGSSERTHARSSKAGCKTRKGKAKHKYVRKESTKTRKDPTARSCRISEIKPMEPIAMPTKEGLLEESEKDHLYKKYIGSEHNKTSQRSNANNTRMGTDVKSGRQHIERPERLFDSNVAREEHRHSSQLFRIDETQTYKTGKRKTSTQLNMKPRSVINDALTTIPEMRNPASLSAGNGVFNSTTVQKDGELSRSLCQSVEDSEELKAVIGNIKVKKSRERRQKNQVLGSNNLTEFTKQSDWDMSVTGKSRPEKVTTEVNKRRQENEPMDRRKLSNPTSSVKFTDGQGISPAQMGATTMPEERTCTEIRQTDQKVTGPSSARTIQGFNISKEQLLKSCNAAQLQCAFCCSSKSTEVSGEMMHYFCGKPAEENHNEGIDVIHSHRYCTEWAPNVYFEGETAINLDNELVRSKRIKCSKCGIKGAALGCYDRSCRRSFHFTCAKLLDCRWDNENFVMLCPLHRASKLPSESANLEKIRKRKLNSKRESQDLAMVKPEPKFNNTWKWPPGSIHKWVLCCSALNMSEKEVVLEFANRSGVAVSKVWNPNVTHVIAATNENGVCKRTLKVLMAIIEGKWILNIDWLKACLQSNGPVEEEQFEIGVDNNGICDGPRIGRLRAQNKKPKLFAGYKFYFMGEFASSYRGYLQELVTAAGGTVLQRKPVPRDAMEDGAKSITCVIYSREPLEKQSDNTIEEIIARRKGEAKRLADSCGVLLADNTWILNSISGSTVLNLEI